ncbi:helix-turn-helix domain-containing protein [Paenibacillus sp. SAF-054]|uniref:helix-turn-helix domain-containing protein n=1 Tax=unclassified Paenibacillus TaxID=185978 RepID=UPI003F7ED26B
MYNFSSKEELKEWIAREVIGTAEAMEIMNCSRQNVHSFVKSGKLKPVKDTGRERFFLKSDVLERKADASIYNRK